jgi:hypothetical protein
MPDQERAILRRSFSMIRERFSDLFVAAFWPYAATAVCFLAVGVYFRSRASSTEFDPRQIWLSMAPIQKFDVILAYIVTLSIPGDLAKASVASLVWEQLEGNRIRAREAISRLLPVLGRLILVSLIAGCATQLGSALYFFPGILASVLFSLAIPVLVIERSGAWAAIAKSSRLSSLRFGTIFSLYAITFPLLVIVAFAIFYGMANLSWQIALPLAWTLTTLLLAVASLVAVTVLTHIYHQLAQTALETAPPGMTTST